MPIHDIHVLIRSTSWNIALRVRSCRSPFWNVRRIVYVTFVLRLVGSYAAVHDGCSTTQWSGLPPSNPIANDAIELNTIVARARIICMFGWTCTVKLSSTIVYFSCSVSELIGISAKSSHLTHAFASLSVTRFPRMYHAVNPLKNSTAYP